MLLLADRDFYGFDMWTRAAASGADLLWRVKSTLSPRHLEALADGSWLARIIPTSGTDRQHRTPLTVRVIDYHLDDGRENPEQYRLLTTILDREEATAEDFALAYAQRWEMENTFDELKTHQRGLRKVLRLKPPPLVQQEIWGHLCCHYAIRTLMLDAATAGGHDPDRMSFVAALRITRRSLSHSSFLPRNHAEIIRLRNPGVTKLLRRINPARRIRANARVVKRKVIKGLPNVHVTNIIRSPLIHRHSLSRLPTERY